MLKVLGYVIVLFGAVAGGFVIAALKNEAEMGTRPAATAAVAEPEPDWIAAAPGRVSPKGGELRLGAPLAGRVDEVMVKANDRVEEGELLFRLDDSEARARLSSSATQAEALREENGRLFASGRSDVQRTEDAVYSAERALTGARIELDYAIAAKRTGNGSSQVITDARKRLKDAKERLDRERLAFVKAQSKVGLPAPTSAEAAVNAARTEVRMAESLLDRARVRAPAAGTVMLMRVKEGEIVAPSVEIPLVIIGDLSGLEVAAEVDEVDVPGVKIGQRAFVRNVGFPGQQFEGKVVRMAPSLGMPSILPRGPRRAADVEVLEVTIALDGKPPLLPGMRVDAFFRRN